MKKILPLFAIALLCGCMSSPKRAPSLWTIDFSDARDFARVESPKAGVARMLAVSVCEPYDGEGLAVLRSDGSIAFDPYNRFAAAPAALVKGFVHEALAKSGLFERVVGANSVAAAPWAVEVTVRELALDCRTEGSRRARVELEIAVIHGREVQSTGRGSGDYPAGNGNYSAAFSKAMNAAVAAAVKEL